MADPTTPQTPAPTPTPSLWQRIKQQCIDIFNKDKGIFLLIAIAAAIVKFRDIFLNILINSARRVDANAKKEDVGLAAQETQAKEQADAAVQQAQQDAPKDTPVDDNWYKKDN
ncbi:unnamed protein product [Sphagnum jensenii]|uniref:Uncharacterized protein n=1 Tax=Sphagnum jensenii TaxID=128206 RepID=A0ABP0V878_9BRYO